MIFEASMRSAESSFYAISKLGYIGTTVLIYTDRQAVKLESELFANMSMGLVFGVMMFN